MEIENISQALAAIDVIRESLDTDAFSAWVDTKLEELEKWLLKGQDLYDQHQGRLATLEGMTEWIRA